MRKLVHISFRVPLELKVKLDTNAALTQRKSYEVYADWLGDFLGKQRQLKSGDWKIPILRRPRAVPVAYVGAEIPPEMADRLKNLATQSGRTQNALFITALTIAKDVSAIAPQQRRGTRRRPLPAKRK